MSLVHLLDGGFIRLLQKFLLVVSFLRFYPLEFCSFWFY